MTALVVPFRAPPMPTPFPAFNVSLGDMGKGETGRRLLPEYRGLQPSFPSVRQEYCGNNCHFGEMDSRQTRRDAVKSKRG